MELNWKTDLSNLRDHVRSNPAIQIHPGRTTIPEENRAEFYRMFDNVRTGFVKQKYPDMVSHGWEIASAYAETSLKIKGKIGSNPAGLARELEWFLEDPVDGLMRNLFDPLFEVIKGGVDVDAFEKQGEKFVESDFRKCFRGCYLHWLELALASQLEADKSYRIPAVDEIANNLMGEGHENIGEHAENVPEAVQVADISFHQHPVVSFMTPRIIVHSALLNEIVAMHSGYIEPQWTATHISPSLDWLDFIALRQEHGVTRLRPDQKMPVEMERILPDILLYTAEAVDDIALVADHKRILRPDISIEIMEDAGWFEQGKASAIKRHHAVMKPRLGTFVICRMPPAQAAVEELTLERTPVSGETDSATAPALTPTDIHVIHAGYDAASLAPLITALNTVRQAI